MSDLCVEDRVASWSTLGLVEERNNVLTIYRYPPVFADVGEGKELEAGGADAGEGKELGEKS